MLIFTQMFLFELIMVINSLPAVMQQEITVICIQRKGSNTYYI